MPSTIKLTLAVVLICLYRPIFCQDSLSSSPSEKNKIDVKYGSKGLNFKTSDGFFNGNLEFRVQFRFYSPFDSDPRSMANFEKDAQTSFEIRRARLKTKGSVYKPWLKYNLEYDLAQGNLLNAEMWIEKHKHLGVHIGRTKVSFNRQRSISSGKQLLTERSIVNRIFTIDRQDGVALYGNAGKAAPLNFSYLLSAYTGTGIQDGINDDNKLMYVGRFQWNLLGGEMEVGEEDSDLEISEMPKANISIAGATNSSPYTRFSTSGGSALDGFEVGEAGQFQVDQFVEDFLFKWKGISLLQEFHKKNIENRVTNETTDMMGYLAQFGIFPKGVLEEFPEQLQFAFRFAHVDPDTDETFGERNEFTVGMNWHFNGFRNRLSVDYSHLTLNQPAEDLSADRFRFQWDVSF